MFLKQLKRLEVNYQKIFLLLVFVEALGRWQHIQLKVGDQKILIKLKLF